MNVQSRWYLVIFTHSAAAVSECIVNARKIERWVLLFELLYSCVQPANSIPHRHQVSYRVATDLEYSGISLNMENSGNSVRRNCKKQSFSLSFKYFCKTAVDAGKKSYSRICCNALLQSFTARMPLLVATSAFGLERRCWSDRQAVTHCGLNVGRWLVGSVSWSCRTLATSRRPCSCLVRSSKAPLSLSTSLGRSRKWKLPRRSKQRLARRVKPTYSNSAMIKVNRTGSKWPVMCVAGQTHPFNGLFSRTTRVSRYQKGKTNLDFTEVRDSEWPWHQLDHMQVCTLLQTDNHANTPPLVPFC